VIDPNALIGQPADVATRVLSAAGLSAHVTAVDAPGVPAGVVTGFDPTGPVTPGATITLDVSRGGAAVPTTTVTTEPGNGNGKGKKPPKH
jgi:beta-lactam-binding protein with PASTA domain